jgi:hypothetical protein
MPMRFATCSCIIYLLVLMRSRWPELAKANHFLTHLAEGQRPSPAQQLRKNRWGAPPPPCAPPPALLRGALAGLRPGWATPWLGYALAGLAQPKTPRGFSAAFPQMGGASIAIAAVVASPHLLFMRDDLAIRGPQDARNSDMGCFWYRHLHLLHSSYEQPKPSRGHVTPHHPLVFVWAARAARFAAHAAAPPVAVAHRPLLAGNGPRCC